MYDLNLSVPNLTSPKYSDDNRFLLLKNYLYELNEMLSFALGDIPEPEIKSIRKELESSRDEEKQSIIQLKNESKKKFEELKNQIIRAAEEIEQDYSTAISKSEEEILLKAQGEFATKTELGEYKNQTDTRFSQTAESISAVAGNAEEISTDLEEYKKTNNAQLTVQAEEILSQVGNIFSARTELGELEEQVYSQISQTAENITEAFSQSITEVQENISSVGGEVREFVSSLDVYIRRGELENGVFGIEIGRSDSNIKARFTNDRLSFYQGISEVAYISGSNLYIARAEVLDYLKIGNSADGYFTFDVSENGLEVMWSGGS